eukprot:scaffold3686_cov193-Alexandrium_tamarense.AAC.7
MSSEPTLVKDSPQKITLRRLETSKLTPSSLDDLMFHVTERRLEAIKEESDPDVESCSRNNRIYQRAPLNRWHRNSKIVSPLLV